MPNALDGVDIQARVAFLPAERGAFGTGGFDFLACPPTNIDPVICESLGHRELLLERL
jgi:hypothetical protein